MEPEDRSDDDVVPTGLDGHVAQFFRDSSLWPVLFVMVAVFVCFGSAMLFFAVVERNPFALAALAVLGCMSVDLVVRDRKQGRFGLTSRTVATLWVLSAGTALALARFGF